VASGHLQKEGNVPLKKLTQLMLDEDSVGYLKLMQMLHLCISDLVLVCMIQIIFGLALVAWLEMPWSLLGCVLVLASAYTLKTIPSIEVEIRNQSS